jgi:hypothetical protein
MTVCGSPPACHSEGSETTRNLPNSKKQNDIMDEKNKSGVWPDENEVIYVSDETYKGVHRALDHMEKAREELRKAAEAGKQKNNRQTDETDRP